MAGLALGAFRIALGCETFQHGSQKNTAEFAEFATMLRQLGPREFLQSTPATCHVC